jgi:AcrR family transcriptional regulator
VNDVKMGVVNTLRSTGTYHHGDLRNALVDAATALAREGGPDAVVLREAARRVDVSAAAAYHHFANREQLVQAVKHRTLALLSGRMQAVLDQGDIGTAPGLGRKRPSASEVARGRLRALGAAYLQFAFDEPGLFRISFGPRGPWPTNEPAAPHNDNVGPFLLLRQVLDELAAAGVVPPERRAGLEYVTWAQAHGIAVLCLDGPLARVAPAEREAAISQTLDTIVRGL